MQKTILGFMILGLLVSVTFTTVLYHAAPVEAQETARELQVVVYPYLPDAAGDGYRALVDRITREFQARHADIRLQIMLNPDLNLYDLDHTLPQLFTPDGPHAIELETEFLGALVSKGWLAPVRYDTRNIAPEASRSATIHGQLYGIPTWMCSRFFITTEPELLRAKDAAEFVALLNTLPPTTPKFIGDFAGSWALPGLYFKAYADTYGSARLAGAFHYPPNTQVVHTMESVVQSCTFQGVNKCLDGAYHQEAYAAALAFAQGQAAGYEDFSESLYYVEAQKRGTVAGLHVMIPPFGNGNHPLMWVDALVINALSCQGQCQADVVSFAEYLNSLETRVWITLSLDAPVGTPPRYLLPATEDFYRDARIQNTPHYLRFKSLIEPAKAYPNSGFPEIRQRLHCALLDEFQHKPPGADCRSAPAEPRHKGVRHLTR